METLTPEADIIYKKLGRERYARLVSDMQHIAEKFKARQQRYEGIITEPLTPTTEVGMIL